MATKVGVREFRDRASQILRRAAEGETFEICNRRRVVARLVPAEEFDRKAAVDRWMRESEALAKEIGAHWQGPQDAVEAVREQRRDLAYSTTPVRLSRPVSLRASQATGS